MVQPGTEKLRAQKKTIKAMIRQQSSLTRQKSTMRGVGVSTKGGSTSPKNEGNEKRRQRGKTMAEQLRQRVERRKREVTTMTENEGGEEARSLLVKYEDAHEQV